LPTYDVPLSVLVFIVCYKTHRGCIGLTPHRTVVHGALIRAFQPGLVCNHQALKQLDLSFCTINADGICLIADALARNTTMQVLNIGRNRIKANGLDAIMRIIESTRIKTMILEYNHRDIFGNEASTRQFAHVLSRHEFLKELNLCGSLIRDEGIRIIVDGLVGNNTFMQVLDIRSSGISRLQSIYFLGNNQTVFHDIDATQRFVTALQHKRSSVQELPEIDEDCFPEDGRATANIINNSLTRNRQLNRTWVMKVWTV
jgi:Leucine Rich repeat